MKKQQRRMTKVLLALALCTCGASVAWSQEQQADKGARPGQQGQASAPDLPQMESQSGGEGRGVLAARMVKFSGVAKDQTGAIQTGILGMTFAIYRDQEGGAALWMETQNVQVDDQGHYSVLLGATKREGLPVELFTGAEPRWLGVQLAGETEQGRVLLVSVPYALKAADAESLGGKPASAYMLAPEAVAGVDTGGTGGSDTGTGPVQTKNRVTARGGKATPQLITANFVPVFTDSNGTLGNSLLAQSGNSMALGQGVSGNPAIQFDVNGGIRGTGLATGTRNVSPDAINTGALFLGGSNAMGVVGTNAQFAPGGLFTKTSFFSGGVERMTVDGTTGNVGIGTTTPAFKLDVAGIFRVQTGNGFFRVDGPVAGTASPVLASWGGSGDFAIDAVGVTGGRFVVKDAGNVGIGTATPSQKLEVQGNAKVSGAGNGIIFPDGTAQTTAAPFPLTPTKSGFNSSIISVGSTGASWTPVAVLTITPTHSGIVNLFVRVRYNFKLAFASQVSIGTFVTSSAAAPTSTTSFTDAVNAGWATGAGTAGGTANGDLPVAFGQTLSVTAGTTLFIWVGVVPINFDSANQLATISSVGLIATLHQAAGI